MSFRTPNFSGNVSGLERWKSEKQQTLVLARLINAGHEVDSETPSSKCWALLTEVLLKEIER